MVCKKGWAKERFCDKHEAEIDRATTFRAGMLNMCKRMNPPEKITPKLWNKELADRKVEDAALTARYGEICSCLETLEQIQQEVASVYRSRQAEQGKETVAEKEQRTGEKRKRREESL